MSRKANATDAVPTADDDQWPFPELPGIRGWLRRERLRFVGQAGPWFPPMNLTDRIVVGLVRRQRIPVLGWLIRGVLHWRGTEVQTTDIGPGFRLMHGGIGVVIHSKSKIGSNVMIFQSVTVGRGDPWRPWSSRYSGFVLEDDVILCAGAVVANSSQRGVLTVGAGTVVGANSVLTQSTGEREIWAGSPARCVGHRDS